MHEFTSYVRERLNGWRGLVLATSEHPELIGAMTAFHLPGGTIAAGLRRGLWERFRVEASVIEYVDHPRIRASTHFYNTETDIDCLAEALGELRADVPLRVAATDVRIRLVHLSLLGVYVRGLEMKQFDNRLDPSTAHLWVVDLASVDTPAVENHRLLLSEEELERAQRFRFERDRRAFLVSYGLLRRALTWVVPGVRPEEWIFTRAPNGRPEIDQPSVLPWPRFNISHTTGLVACLVTAENDCGVDVEAVVPFPDLESLSRRILAPSERAHIAALPDHERHCGFLRLWTLKEAYAKARGLGVSIPFEQLPFECHGDGIRLDIDPTLDDGGQWYFEQWRARPGYILSLAVRRGQEAFRGVVRHTGVPSPTPP